MDQIHTFPENISTTVVPVKLSEKPEALEYAARQGQVRACIIYQEPNTKRVFVLFCKDNWYQKKKLVDNYNRAIMEAKHVNEFRPDDVLLEKIAKGLLRNADRTLINTEKRMLPPPTPAHVTAETNKRPLEQQPGPSSKRNRVFITPVIRPPVLIARPSTALATPQPVSIPEPPVLTTPQILLPDSPRPPELTTPLVQIPDPPVQIPVFQPPVQLSPEQLFLPDPAPLCRSFYQIHHLWSRLCSRPLWTTLQ
ncbi:uncharacterized protein TNCV_2048051 [Trichonephila clavipes]|nr:uncharacterized protein TNCV_2048051 [Trichonephila clavipes]